MEHIRIDYTDIILQDFGDGKGKIIISDDDYGYNFSYYWGAMGKDTSLKQFLQEINTDYFVGKLSSHTKGPLNVRKTFVALRKYIQESFKYELPWYEHVKFQKDFRERLKYFQKSIGHETEFIIGIEDFHNQLDYYLIEDRAERERIETLFKSIFYNCEPWDFVENDPHPEELFLSRLHPKLKKALSKPVQLCLF